MLEVIYSNILIPWTILGLLTFIILLKVSAPYGKFSSDSWGPSMSFKWGWMIQEIVSPIIFSISFLCVGGDDKGIAWIFFIIWNVHYFNRSILFPLRQKQADKCPVAIVLFAIFFNVINGFTNGYFLGYLDQYDFNYIYSLEFIIGFVVLILGVVINVKSDNILIDIKKKYNDYQIPNGFMYKYISCPNYFGEIIEWVGFYIMTASAPALVFVFWTMCNLIPRAISNHNWYINKFSDYPKKRKAIIPFLI